ncbi:hypothetical protein MU448_12175 [Streptococcus sp. O1]|uniref:hypothetical protein n=1 Tax=Streptococcus sp. O1 TaxID=2928735 RepID=UPI00211AC4C2|nr:hypothetical protein [Streptococcus sp. O1]MCQ9215094.1 hypothetical protein [Streptococcus sp. O1]
MSYRVIRSFADGTDKGANHPNGFLYSIGDIYPRNGYEPNKDFLQSLLDGTNTTGSIFIVYDGEVQVDIRDVAQETLKIEKKTRSRKKKR